MKKKTQAVSFRESVHGVVSKIKRGETLTYSQVARLAGSPRAYRAVGNILNQNHSLRIPCHRVIRSDSSVGGYNRGARRKMALLRKEKAL